MTALAGNNTPPGENLKSYLNDANNEIVAADLLDDGSAPCLSTTANLNLPVGAVLREKDIPDSPHYTVIALSARSNGDQWLTPVELLMQDFTVSYSFITFTHSTIAGSMNQKAATKAEAISQARAWLTMIYQPVEFDHVSA